MQTVWCVTCVNNFVLFIYLFVCFLYIASDYSSPFFPFQKQKYTAHQLNIDGKKQDKKCCILILIALKICMLHLRYDNLNITLFFFSRFYNSFFFISSSFFFLFCSDGNCYLFALRSFNRFIFPSCFHLIALKIFLTKKTTHIYLSVKKVRWPFRFWFHQKMSINSHWSAYKWHSPIRWIEIGKSTRKFGNKMKLLFSLLFLTSFLLYDVYSREIDDSVVDTKKKVICYCKWRISILFDFYRKNSLIFLSWSIWN